MLHLNYVNIVVSLVMYITTYMVKVEVFARINVYDPEACTCSQEF